MITITLDHIKPLGFKKAVQMPKTTRLQKKMLEFQIASSDLDTKLNQVINADEIDVREYAKVNLDMINVSEQFVIDVLRLNDAQIEKLEELDDEQVGELVQGVIMDIMGIDPNAVDDDEEEEDSGEE
jgi:hypothetical protein